MTANGLIPLEGIIQQATEARHPTSKQQLFQREHEMLQFQSSYRTRRLLWNPSRSQLYSGSQVFAFLHTFPCFELVIIEPRLLINIMSIPVIA